MTTGPRLTPARAEPKKPVLLQANTRGSWANLVVFDVGNDIACAHALDAVDTLGRLHHGVVSFRLVTDDPLRLPLMRWTREHGWTEVRHAE